MNLTESKELIESSTESMKSTEGTESTKSNEFYAMAGVRNCFKSSKPDAKNSYRNGTTVH